MANLSYSGVDLDGDSLVGYWFRDGNEQLLTNPSSNYLFNVNRKTLIGLETSDGYLKSQRASEEVYYVNRAPESIALYISDPVGRVLSIGDNVTVSAIPADLSKGFDLDNDQVTFVWYKDGVLNTTNYFLCV